MKRASAPQHVAPSETEEPNLSLESATLAPEDIHETAPTTNEVPEEVLERGGDSYHVHHWGINE